MDIAEYQRLSKVFVKQSEKLINRIKNVKTFRINVREGPCRKYCRSGSLPKIKELLRNFNIKVFYKDASITCSNIDEVLKNFKTYFDAWLVNYIDEHSSKGGILRVITEVSILALGIVMMFGLKDVPIPNEVISIVATTLIISSASSSIMYAVRTFTEGRLGKLLKAHEFMLKVNSMYRANYEYLSNYIHKVLSLAEKCSEIEKGEVNEDSLKVKCLSKTKVVVYVAS